MRRLLRRVSTICLPEQREFDEPIPPSLPLLQGEESYQIYRTHVNNTGRCYAIVSRFYAIAGQCYAIAGQCYAIASRYINNAADALTL
ncbi:hypothetical protein [Nostoc sp.]|uniref:hypothetical protein n=1 Tax=Nostoc sp. TaxID=1180 RepID=UPI002FF601C2